MAIGNYKGYHGKILIINLNDQTWEEKALSKTLVDRYIGGRGLGTKLLYDLQGPGVDPLSPGNHLLFLSGPLAGSSMPGSSRLAAVTKSPASGTISASSMGGSYPTYFKRTGYDAVVFKGKAKRPVWVELGSETVKFHNAEKLWGMQATETENQIKSEVDGRCESAVIGPAGENQVRYAAIVSGTRTAARGGVGAVMGSKNLKAVAAVGTVVPPVAERQKLTQTAKSIHASQKTNTATVSLREHGTNGMIFFLNMMDLLPTKNFQYGTFEQIDAVTGEKLTSTLRVKGKTCMACSVGCSLIAEIEDGPYKGTETEGPDYETVGLFGSNLLIDDLNVIATANYLCDEYGLDTISAGNVIGFAMECWEKGIFTPEMTGGLELEWGNGEVALKLIELIARREGIGDLLAQGVARVAQQFPESEHFAMHVKGLEIAAYDPRGLPGQGLSYAISPRGGDHGKGGYMPADLFAGDADLFDPRGKAKRAIDLAEICAVNDFAEVCNFNYLQFDQVAQILSLVIGRQYTVDDLRQAAQETIRLERAFNVREGFSRKDDSLPPRLTQDPLPNGAAAGKKVDDLDYMLDDYYQLMGWSKNGIPGNKLAAWLHKWNFKRKYARKGQGGGPQIELPEFNWQDNSKEMATTVLAKTPAMFRKRSRQSLIEAIQARANEDQAVTEEIVIQSITEITPDGMLDTVLGNIKHLKSE